MASAVYSIAGILLSTALFLMAHGLIGTLTPLRANIDGFSDVEVGALGAWYFAGFVIGCFAGPHLLAAVGHIRAFAVAAAVVTVNVLIQPVWPDPIAWYAIRGITGSAIAILYMAVESWLNDRASNETRGRILSVYVVVNLVALLLGQWLLLFAEPESFELFSIGAALYALCLVPIGLTRLSAPAPRAAPRLNLLRILGLAPVGAAGCIAVGLANGAFWTLAPIYGQSLGFTARDLALFMSLFIAGGALVQWPLGRISDGMDRRWVIAVTCAAASLCGLLLGLFGSFLVGRPELFSAVVFTLGAAMLPLYSLSIAHANDRFPREEFVEVSAGLLLINAAASVPGPLLAALVVSRAGASSLFLWTAAIHVAMALYAFTRIRVKEPAPPETRDMFTPVPPGSPAVLPLDPRGPKQENTP